VTIPAAFIQELIARTDVVEVVGRHVTLKKGGANFTGLCPFHDEKSPSFSVSPTKQFYHCFGCGASGDAIRFLTEYTGASFVEAVQDLAQQVGLEVPNDDISADDRARAHAQKQRQATLFEVLEKAGEAYRGLLKNSPRAVDYLKRRGLTGTAAARFGLGYAPEGWRTLAGIFPAYDDPLLAESGLVIVGEEALEQPEAERKRYDRFRDRIMFPIRNVKGECIGFGGRVLGDEKPKYLNSPETPVFSKGRELYGLFEARAALREHGCALVTEGYMDVVALAQLGFPNAVATLGTACTPDHLQKLFRFTDCIVFSFDGDGAGRRAARKALDAALPLATDTRAVKFLFLPAEHDPDSFIRANGKDAFARHVEEAVPLSRFLIDAAREACDMSTAEGRAHMTANARPLWSALPDGALRRQLLVEIAQHVQLPAEELAALWSSQAAAEAARTSRFGSVSTHGNPDTHNTSAPTTGKRWNRGFGDGGRDDAALRNNSGATSRRSGRQPPQSRADQAARLLMLLPGAFDRLDHEERMLLAEQPAPHGALFVRMERELQEHGPRPWAALREGLKAEPEVAALAERLMGGTHAETEASGSELQTELRGVLDRMLMEHLKAAETVAIAAAANGDADALRRYSALQAKRQALSTRLSTAQRA
jgi:DNA primase